MRLSHAHQVVAYPGEVTPGDAVFAAVNEAGALFAVIDGLGHGPAAAAAARAAVQVLEANVACRDVVAIMQAIHGALVGTRGAAVTLCCIEDDRLSCCGVGNVAFRSIGAEVPFVLSPGIVGGQVRRFRRIEARVRPRQRLILHTDGIASDLALDRIALLDASGACDALFRLHRKRTDDAAVLVVDVRESP